MNSPSANSVEKHITSFWKLFRLTFVIFSLYLMGDAFSRWDGFSFYASFSEFLPSAAFALIIWSMVAVIVSLFLGLLLNLWNWVCKKTGLKFNSEHLLFCTGVFLLTGALLWKSKRIIWPNVETSRDMKLIALASIVFVSIIVTVVLRKKARRWLGIVHDRVTPLFWLFVIAAILAVPLTGYHIWFKKTGKIISLQSLPAASTDNSSPNIILVTFDALTARNMSLYGYHRPTTPFISEWSKKATVFTRIEAESNFTTSSAASLLTGKRVWSHRTFQIEGTPVRSREESLPAVLKKNGYYNMAFVVNPHISVDKLGMADSFDIAPIPDDFGEPVSLVGWQFGYINGLFHRLVGNKIRLSDWVLKNDFILGKLLAAVSADFSSTTVPPAKAFGRFLKTIEGMPRRPFFAWIHLFPPHDPYLPPETFRHIFSSSSELRSYKSQEDIKQESYKFLFDYLKFPENLQPSVDLFKDYYDEYIRYCDTEFEAFIKGVRDRNLGNTIVILSADHGESFEHGYFTHGGPFLYEQVTHIPFIIEEPGQEKGQVLNDRVEQIDITATILDLADIPVPSWMEGRSLVPLMQGYKLSDRPAFSMNFEENRSRGHQITTGSVGIWEGDYKLIHYLDKNSSLLFDLAKDPGELHNIFDDSPEIAQRLLNLLKDNLDSANERIRKENIH